MKRFRLLSRQIVYLSNNIFIKIITEIRKNEKSYLLNDLFYNYLIQSCVNKKETLKWLIVGSL